MSQALAWLLHVEKDMDAAISSRACDLRVAWEGPTSWDGGSSVSGGSEVAGVDLSFPGLTTIYSVTLPQTVDSESRAPCSFTASNYTTSPEGQSVYLLESMRESLFATAEKIRDLEVHVRLNRYGKDKMETGIKVDLSLSGMLEEGQGCKLVIKSTNNASFSGCIEKGALDGSDKLVKTQVDLSTLSLTKLQELLNVAMTRDDEFQANRTDLTGNAKGGKLEEANNRYIDKLKAAIEAKGGTPTFTLNV